MKESIRQTARMEEITRRRIELLLEPILQADADAGRLSAQNGLTPDRIDLFLNMAQRLVTTFKSRYGSSALYEDREAGPGPFAIPESELPDGEVMEMVMTIPDTLEVAVGEQVGENELWPAGVGTAAEESSTPASMAAAVNEPDFRIYCLGNFQVYRGQRQIDEWTGYRSRCLMKYFLVDRHRPALTEQLLDIFWPDSSPDSARRSLHQTIYVLRQALRLDDDRSSIIQVDGGYMLNPDLDVWVDSEVFFEKYREGVRAADQGDGERSVMAFGAAEALYGGDFMGDEPYEDWPVARREQARNAYLDLLDRLSIHYWSVSQDEKCLTYCRKLLEIDNCREDVHRRAMRVYARRGDRSRALRQFQQCVEALRAELDVDPLPETVSLYEKILNNSFQA